MASISSILLLLTGYCVAELITTGTGIIGPLGDVWTGSNLKMVRFHGYTSSLILSNCRCSILNIASLSKSILTTHVRRTSLIFCDPYKVWVVEREIEKCTQIMKISSDEIRGDRLYGKNPRRDKCAITLCNDAHECNSSPRSRYVSLWLLSAGIGAAALFRGRFE